MTHAFKYKGICDIDVDVSIRFWKLIIDNAKAIGFSLPMGYFEYTFDVEIADMDGKDGPELVFGNS